MAERLERPPDLTDSAIARISSSDRSLQLEDLVAQATLKYSIKDYDAAAELYAYATELQAEINGEMSPNNASLLYAYGRCLYHVAIGKSDVLGSVVVGERGNNGSKPAESKRQVQRSNNKTEVSVKDKDDDTGQKMAQESIEDAQIAQAKTRSTISQENSNDKPYFHFTGDEEWDTSGNEMQDDDISEDPDDEQDDFLDAYEVLDMARLLLHGKVIDLERDTGHEKCQEDLWQIRQLKEKLADTHDLQAEICLEGERFSSAVDDLKTSLQIKRAILPQESSLIAEAHYKLSLALEFLSVTMQKNALGKPAPGSDSGRFKEMREEAADELKAAINSCKLRLEKEERALNKTHPNVRDSKATETAINDVKEMVKDLEQRLLDIRQPFKSSIDVEDAGRLDEKDLFKGILGALHEKSPAARRAELEAVSRDAKDLSGLIKKRSARQDALPTVSFDTTRTSGKRKAEELDEAECGESQKLEAITRQ